MRMPELEIYSMIGAEGFGRLVAAFYRQVPLDDLLGPIYPASDLPGAEQRLRDFLIGRFGGPQTYIEQRGHPRLRAAAFAVCYQSDCPRPLDAADGKCVGGSFAAKQSGRSPSEILQ